MSTSAAVTRRTAWRRVGVAAVILVPLAFAGLFVGALPNGDDAQDAIPAAVVNQDQLIYQDAPDGTKTPVFAGRQLVTELTKAGSGFNWSVSNAADAREALRAGDIDAVLTIPKDFSKSILSLSSGAPQRADLSIRTDDSHSYLTGVVAQSVGSSMVGTFGKTITERYISGITSGVGELGGALEHRGDGSQAPSPTRQRPSAADCPRCPAVPHPPRAVLHRSLVEWTVTPAALTGSAADSPNCAVARRG